MFAICMILLTVVTYFMMTKIYRRYSYSLLIPALTATTLIIIILLVLHIPYKSYMIGGQWINSLLGPSVVALAYPLFKQRRFLMNNLFPILGGALVGAITGMVSIGILSKMFGINHTLILSLIPKSITTPVAIEVSKGLGGNASMTIVAVMIAGIFGAIIAPTIFKFARVHSPIGRGIALGSASHAIGTSKAAEYNELTFSMSSVTMTLCAIIGSFLGPIVVWLFHI
ncbi:putative murein hydrolase (TIGR00659 family) [Scopulibacillus darangshiensis]|uniref:Putative murein hydrolase (TIGR00659 family) n=1 Tax=Scopulibacillus darangshiensis TaxID=442528 RepID=A0A4R2NJR2_9BACL|nr:LrgB family protein [Scopulibacillus darangshiensis]TCP21717.1 putative murein hydrolase (TIGR00659 family) [Scopulibacillus darangshiensis]